MSTVEKPLEAARGGASDTASIAVENPATGATIAHVPDMRADEVAALGPVDGSEK